MKNKIKYLISCQYLTEAHKIADKFGVKFIDCRWIPLDDDLRVFRLMGLYGFTESQFIGPFSLEEKIYLKRGGDEISTLGRIVLKIELFLNNLLGWIKKEDLI